MSQVSQVIFKLSSKRGRILVSLFYAKKPAWHTLSSLFTTTRWSGYFLFFSLFPQDQKGSLCRATWQGPSRKVWSWEPHWLRSWALSSGVPLLAEVVKEQLGNSRPHRGSKLETMWTSGQKVATSVRINFPGSLWEGQTRYPVAVPHHWPFIWEDSMSMDSTTTDQKYFLKIMSILNIYGHFFLIIIPYWYSTTI